MAEFCPILGTILKHWKVAAVAILHTTLVAKEIEAIFMLMIESGFENIYSRIHIFYNIK